MAAVSQSCSFAVCDGIDLISDAFAFGLKWGPVYPLFSWINPFLPGHFSANLRPHPYQSRHLEMWCSLRLV